MHDWQTIAARYGPLVWQTAYRLLANEADAADCCQETFISVLNVARHQDVEHWPGLLQHLATARALDQLRRRVRQTRGQVSADWDLMASDEPEPEEQIEDAELMERLRAALGHLPAQQSEVFCLRHLNELSYEEIAEQLDMTVDAVGVNLYRARQRLRGLLAELRADVSE